MSEEPRPSDDPFLPLLVAFDEDLAAGRETPPAVPPELTERFEAARSVLQLLERAWPRGGPGDTTVDLPQAPAEGAAKEGTRPSLLGKFQVLGELGRGGFGVVYLARDTELGRRVALKTPRWDRWLTSELRQRFLQEGRAAAALEHPNIVPVYEAGEAGPLCYIASAYCEGGSLAAWLRRQTRPVPCRLAAAFAADLAGGVRHAHGRGVVHRDLKPSNILLQGDGADGESMASFTPKIGDFGLAKLVEEEGTETPSGVVMGTPAYMAPEQAEGRVSEIGPAADIYGLGVVLYEMLTGAPPFQGSSHAETLRLVASASPKPPRRLRKDVPRDLQGIILTCLEKDPTRRYASAAALETDLRRWLDGKAPLGRPEPLGRRVGRWLRGHKTLTAAALLLGLLAVGGLIAAPYFDPDRPAKTATARLVGGDQVELIGEKGRPVWSRWRTGAEKAQTEIAGDGTFRINSTGVSVLELLPYPGRASFRLRARVRHDGGSDPACVGLFFAGQEYPTPRGPVQVLGVLTFDEYPFRALPGNPMFVNPKKDPVCLRPRVWSDPEHAANWDLWCAGQCPPLFEAVGLTPAPPWRSLVADVTPEGVSAYWEGGAPVGRTTTAAEWRQSLAAAVRKRREILPDDPTQSWVQTDFTPGGALGLYVERSSASFRDVLVGPIP